MDARRTQQPVFTVSQLTSQIKDALETVFPSVWVEGELSDVSAPQSGHIYFTLKDDRAQVRCVIWRSVARRLKFKLEDGQEIVCRGNLDVYPPRGAYQLIIQQAEPRGLGALQLALRQLQQRLAAEGLFDPERKRPLPRFPRRIAVVTSPTGAAVRDFLEVARRRWRGAHVLIVPTRVQGPGAGLEIAAAIRTANQLQPAPDVVVVTRGGGSLEDLWSFNEEVVVRAIFASKVPVVSAVGHEIDVSLSDLVADIRALTPTEAAERVLPSAEDLQRTIQTLQERMSIGLRRYAETARARLEYLANQRVFRRPLERVRELSARFDDLQLRAERATRQRLVRQREQLSALAGRLESLSPLSVLARGYSLTQRADDGTLIESAQQVEAGELIRTRLSQGEIVSRVE